MTYQLHHGNCIDIMPLIERESVDAIVTDPPYGLGFMGKDWDHGVPGEHFWREAYRCVKPGAYLLAFGGTRTFHRLAVAIEDAGWEIRDTVMWVYGQGFPKSHDVSKAIDREAGAEREVISTIRKTPSAASENMNAGWRRPWAENHDNTMDITQPATPAAAEWDGWGTALKPAWEPIIVARKPLAGTVAENVQRYGTGAMNIDKCRIETGDKSFSRPVNHTGLNEGWDRPWRHDEKSLAQERLRRDESERKAESLGRWPANLIHDGSAEVLAGFPMTNGGAFPARRTPNSIYGGGNGTSLDQLGGPRVMGDTGSAARFFYCAKASKADRGSSRSAA